MEMQTNPFHVQLDALEEVMFAHFQLGRPLFLVGIQKEGEVSLPHFDHLHRIGVNQRAGLQSALLPSYIWVPSLLCHSNGFVVLEQLLVHVDALVHLALVEELAFRQPEILFPSQISEHVHYVSISNRVETF